jgi:hypothetical protein
MHDLAATSLIAKAEGELALKLNHSSQLSDMQQGDEFQIGGTLE